MPPKRGQQRKAAPQVSEPVAVAILPPVDGVRSAVEAAVSTWDSGGQDNLRETLSSQLSPLDSNSTPLAALPLSQALSSLLSSTISSDALVPFLSTFLEGLDDRQKDELSETLVDVVEVLESEKEDCEDFEQANGMEVDGEGAKPTSPGQKGMEVVKALLDSSHIPSHIPNLLFSPERLLALGLHPMPHNPAALQRAYVKRNTTLFFKQSKYNLLRESSEGFSCLIVLLTGPDALHSSPAEEVQGDIATRAKRVWGKVMALIGYFNLSPPRVLDLMLEVASCHVALHWRFWMELIRCSPWGEATEDTRGRETGKGKEKAVEGWVDDELQGIREVLLEGGDRVLAQVLGVKFGFYQRADGGDTPVGLVFIAALLVKHGFVALNDLLPFLSPDDAEMENIRKKWLLTVSSRSGPSNALSNSVLLDDDSPATSSAAAEASGLPPKPPPEQRIQLLHALLSLGDLPAAEYLLARFPWVAQSHPAISDLIMQIVAGALENVYRAFAAQSLQGSEEGEFDLLAPAPTLRLTNKEVVSTLYNPPPPETPTKRFEFFYPHWRETMEIWETPEDIRVKGLRWLQLTRGLAARSLEVMVKICRLGAAHFAALRKEKEAGLGFTHGAKTKDELRSVEPTADEMEPWLDIIRISLLPALSTSNATAAFDLELWALLRHFPYPVRYCLYGEWRDSTCRFGARSVDPTAAHAAAECTREIKKALSRVTAASSAPALGAGAGATDRGPARALAKLSHTNPCALWTTAVQQVKSYSNIGQYIVEAGRYMTQLSMDVATFTLVDTLSDDTAPRVTENGSVAMWLENLATFVGDFNRRFAQMDLEPVLQFVINRLMRGESNDLTILQSLLSVMSGLTKIDNDAISDDQLKAYATGREMVREAFNLTTLAIVRPADGDPGQKVKEAPMDKTKSTKRSLPRLINALRDTHLALPIWIALAQTRQGAVDRMASAPIKAMSSMQDVCHDIFIQYGDLLSEQLTSVEHTTLTPELASLVQDFGLDFAMAFQVLRPRLQAELERAREEDKAAVQKRLLAEKQALEARNNSPTKETTPLPGTPAAEAMEVDGGEGQEVVLEESKDGRNAPFFVIFWHLTMPDISFSAESYQKAIDKINAMEKDVASWRMANTADQKAERARLKARAEILSKERDAQAALVNGPNRRRLRLESTKWFGKAISEKNQQKRLSTQLHQYCFFPRSLLTPSDAVFVARFIRLAHDFGTAGFSTLFSYNNFFNEQLAACIFSCTENEARNLGRCLGAIMADLDSWHGDQGRYSREALGKPDKVPEGEEPPAPLPGMLFRQKAGADMKPMAWNQFRLFYAKCHDNLTNALVSCWSEGDFMHIKNAITVALQVLKSFPAMESNNKAIREAVEQLLKDKELTPDVQHQCNAYLRNLTKRQESKPLVTPVAFRAIPSAKPAGAPAGPGRAVPTAPRKPATPGPAANGEAKANGTASPSVAAPSGTDPKVLRQKLEEARARNASANAARGDAKAASASPAPRVDKAASAAASPAPEEPVTAETEAKPAAPPAGPRATRSSTNAPSGPARVTRGASAEGRASSIPTGPSKTPTGPPGLPQRPAPTPASSMGPPTGLSVDEERAAARARKFGTLAKAPTPVAPTATPTGPAAGAPAEVPGTQSPAPASSRRSSPGAGSARNVRRSGSVESRASERSRVERRDRDDRERAERDRERDGHRTRDERDSRRDRDTATRGDRRTPANEVQDRQRQEDLLQARHDKLAAEEGRSRRSSREGHRRETDREREERKVKERERDEKRGEDESGGVKRKRDEEPRSREEGMSVRKENLETSDEAIGAMCETEGMSEETIEGMIRGTSGAMRDDPTTDVTSGETIGTIAGVVSGMCELLRVTPGACETPERRETRGATRGALDAGGTTNGGDRTPKRDALPQEGAAPGRPASAQGDRIIEPPRPTRASEARNLPPPQSQRGEPPRGSRPPPEAAEAAPSSRGPHGLPARPQGDSRSNAPTPPRPASASLAARMGPAPSASPSGSPAVMPPARSPERPDRDGAESAEPRKRPLEESGTPSREESPGASKRVKIDRDRARRGRDGAGNRMLANAMKSANDNH
ncbi:hypothetical protein EHS25_006608 [Saitozyma podzolica]|uniref:THO complex subunit 2 n=1 Tax=Saitozyma podzolica TaxID=1890683 RepID=A0A427YSI8_9TREE|nr:hypothetical protein EHS25_006608 [Saitozyma podzolica]